jgi:crossover junction endodeoxyribonuclease RuvC
MTKSKKFSPMRNSKILGIDPGYGRVGIAIIEKSGKGEKLIHSECFETDIGLPHSQRLFLVGKRVQKMIEKYSPDKIAIETLLWSKNKKTALQVAEARGVILFEAAKKNILICEYNPNQIKLAITGWGKSDKKQIIYMVQKLLRLDQKFIKQKRYDDEYDAIAAALTCSAISLSTDLLV